MLTFVEEDEGADADVYGSCSAITLIRMSVQNSSKRGGFGGRQRLGMPRRVLRDRVAVLALLLQAERLPG